MISLVRLSVWIWPSRAAETPRAVTMVGRPFRSTPSFVSTARVNSGPWIAAMNSRKSWAVFERRQGKGAGMGDQRIIGIDRAHRLGAHEARHHRVRKRLARQGRGLECGEINGRWGHDAEILSVQKKRKNS